MIAAEIYKLGDFINAILKNIYLFMNVLIQKTNSFEIFL